ncbi:nuclear transport factor 2 family protein [Oerskovia sp. Sa1BUA8]|uniref:Nuclear transport factor 2 family protein n=1 Tax=Oerskovia douganii TaxID=2762210 RepID=A0A9D5UBB9_9CELL|nr:nuclear transport factor 2 family protein [Oerskovia douganii]MBE7701959.1 nuclear transport factor 2 family protein [Oerskovia douganii]
MTVHDDTHLPATHQDAVRGLLDREEVARLVSQLTAALDDGDSDRLRDLLVPDAHASTPGGTAQGIDAVVAQAARNHRPEDGVQHLVGNVLVDLAHDHAEVRANVVATFARREPRADRPVTLGAVYRLRARRTGAGWRLTHITTDPVWASTAPVTLVGHA